MDKINHKLMLADDDIDDCIFFRDALQELPITATLSTANNGIELMQFLNDHPDNLPDILFLDLNMPRKTGFECLTEIKLNKNLRNLPIVVFSTSFDHKVVNTLYEKGVHYYLRKPGEFSKLKQLIHKAISLLANKENKQPIKENFILNSS
jgi:CheY-like chemotaxis protein